MNNGYSNLRKELQNGKPVITFTTGTSMEPLLHDKTKKNATHVLVVPVEDHLNVSDMPLVQLTEEKYMIHRIIRIEEKDGQRIYITRGDNCIGCERILPHQILGVVTEIYEKEKTIRVTDRGYLRYVKRRMNTFPIRKGWAMLRGFASKIKRKFL